MILQRFGVRLAVRTMGTYLARWGFTAQKPLRRAYEQDRAAVCAGCGGTTRRSRRGPRPKAALTSGVIVGSTASDGLRSDDVRGRSYAPRGRTPPARVCYKWVGVSLISAMTNRGELRWLIVDGVVKALDLIHFLQRLIRDAQCKVFLILDRLKVHLARLTQDWLAEHRSEIEVYYLR
jgi:hypothetical protein